MTDVDYPINGQFSLSEVVDALSLTAFISGYSPVKGISSLIADSAQRIRSFIVKTNPSYSRRIMEPLVYDAANAGAFLYLIKAGIPGLKAMTAIAGDRLMSELTEIANNAPDQYGQNASSTISHWVQKYAAYIDIVLDELGLSITDPLTKLIDKLADKTDAQFTLASVTPPPVKGYGNDKFDAPNMVFTNRKMEMSPVYLSSKDIVALHDTLTQRLLGVSDMTKPFKI